MSGTTKSKKGFRAFFRDAFGSNTTLSSSSPERPASTSLPPAISAQPEQPSATPQPTKDETNKEWITNGAWIGLRTSLQVLRSSSGVLSPLSEAAEILLECLDGIETAARNQQDYEDLANQLAALNESLVGHVKTTDSTPVSKCISGVIIGIEQQAKEIKDKMSRGTGGRLFAARSDEDDVMRHYRRIQSLFQQMQANLSMSTWGVVNEHLANTRLEALRPVKEATYDSTLSSTVNRRECTEGTRTNILSDLDRWLYDDNMPKVYWMNGMAGTGKTTIACTFAKRLEDRELLAASFFCTRTSVDCRNVTRIVPTIAYQLARYSIPFQSALCEVLGKEPDAGSKTTAKQFERLLRDPLKQAKDAIPDNLVVVIDALDECEDRKGVEGMLNMLFRYAPDIPLRFLVLSRPEPEIYKRMDAHTQSRAVIHLHDIELSLVKADIALYLQEELSFMSLAPAQISQLVEQSGSLFIYAATLVRYIQSGESRADPQRRLESVLGMTPEATRRHAQIDSLYTAVLASALNEEEMEKGEIEDIRVVLRTVLFAQEPISIETVATLAGIGDARRVRSALLPLGSVLHQSETGLVSTLHASFPDFMFSNERSGTYFCDIIEHSQVLAERCLSAMKQQLRFNMCKLETSLVPDEKVEDLQQRIQEHISPTLLYACRYWGNHLALCAKSGSLLGLVKEFICDRLLWWMEVLSLKRQIVVGIETLVKTKQWLNQAGSGSVELVLLLEDARNFVTGFASSPACQSTPHIYISSLPLCPRSSTVYKNYWHRTRGLLELKGSLMERREGAALATWNIGSIIYSVAYSPDGSRVAVGCSDHTIRILNAHDGTPVVDPPHCPNEVNSVTFSPDGTLIASGSDDYAIHVWNAYNGNLVAGSFKGHTKRVWSVAFSPDGTHIVSGSEDWTIRIWNTQDGTLIRDPLEGHTDTVYSVAYSPDGTLIASGSLDKTVRLWHSCDGTPAHSPFEGHTNGVFSICFTPDGTRLVSGSDDKTIRVWNISDGSLVGSPFEGHTSGVRSVAVSPDGTRVASGSDDNTVRVWNTEDGSLVSGPFIGHTEGIRSVAYSLDGTRVISGSGDGTIRVWNVRDGILLLPIPFHSHMANLESLSLSTAGSRFISCSTDDNPWQWNFSTGGMISCPLQVEGHTTLIGKHPPSSLAAPYAVVSTKEHSLQVLNTNDFSLVAGPLHGHTGTLTSSAFSADNNQLATGSYDRTIRLWDLERAQSISGPLLGHGSVVTTIGWSSDRTCLISCSSSDNTIRVWNVQDPTIQLAPSLNLPPRPSQDVKPTSILDDWQIREDGWVVNGNSHLLVWVPVDLRQNHAWPSPHVEFIVTKNGVLHVPKQELLLGDQWARCYIPT